MAALAFVSLALVVLTSSWSVEGAAVPGPKPLVADGVWDENNVEYVLPVKQKKSQFYNGILTLLNSAISSLKKPKAQEYFKSMDQSTAGLFRIKQGEPGYYAIFRNPTTQCFIAFTVQGASFKEEKLSKVIRYECFNIAALASKQSAVAPVPVTNPRTDNGALINQQKPPGPGL